MNSDPVLNLLQKENIPFTVSGKDYVISCLNPEHEDNNPSCRVDKITGITHCFSCGFKANLFKYFGITTQYSSVKLAKLKEKLNSLSINFNGVEFPSESSPVTKTYRGISLQTLKYFDAFLVMVGDDKYIDRIWFPIKDIRGKNMAYIGRLMLSSGNPRYRVYPSGIPLPLYPETFNDRYKSIVLVEGIFDMLNLYDKGLQNVVCAFGTDTLSKDAVYKLLPYKVQGIEKIYLMFDGDEPGQQAMQRIQPILEEAGFEVEIIKLQEDSDPGDLSEDDVASIKAWINEKDSNSRQSS